MELILFIIFKLLAIISAVFVVNAKNPVHAVLLLILVFANIASLLLLLDVELLALVFLVVYVGAIAVLFLFVVMVLNIKIVELSTSELNYLPLNVVITVLLGLQVSYLTYSTFHPSIDSSSNFILMFTNILDSVSNIGVIGQALYLYYFFPFLLTGCILLIAMIGSIMLTLTHQVGTRRQEVFKQNSREILETLVKHV